MPIFTCPKCSSRFDPGVDMDPNDLRSDLSLKVPCPGCGQWVRLPEEEAIPPPKLPPHIMEAMRSQSKLVKEGRPSQSAAAKKPPREARRPDEDDDDRPRRSARSRDDDEERPRSGRRRDDDDDEDRPRSRRSRDDEDDDADRPRPRRPRNDEDDDADDRRPRRKQGGSLLLWLFLGGGVLVAGGVTLVLILVLGGSSHESLVRDMIAVNDELAGVLENVKDQPSAKNAAPAINRLADRVQQLGERAAKLDPPTPEETKRILAAALTQGEKVGQRLVQARRVTDLVQEPSFREALRRYDQAIRDAGRKQKRK